MKNLITANRRRTFGAWLHLTAGAFVVGTTTTLWVCAALLAPSFDGSFVPGLLTLFGRPIGIALIGLGSVEIVGAIAVLRQRRWGSLTLMAISVLHLPIFPIGTALSAYTAWAFLS